MDPLTKSRLRNRLRRLRGQVTGVERMLDEDQDCVSVLLQLSAIQGAIGKVSQTLLGHHIESCLVEAIEHGDEAERATKIDELIEIVNRHGSR